MPGEGQKEFPEGDRPARERRAGIAGRTRLVDIGCGAGDSLSNFGLCDCQFAVGVDISLEALLEARRRVPTASFVLARAEALPFPDSVFDRAISAVALPYTDIPVALAEIGRVLRPGGRATLSFHSLGFAIRDLARRLRTLRVKAILGGVWVLLNGLCFNLFDRSFRLPFSKDNRETWQSRASLRRALARGGFAGEIEAPFVINVEK